MVRSRSSSHVPSVGVFAIVLPGRAIARDEDASGPSLTVYSSADPAEFDPQQFIAQLASFSNVEQGIKMNQAGSSGHLYV